MFLDSYIYIDLDLQMTDLTVKWQTILVDLFALGTGNYTDYTLISSHNIPMYDEFTAVTLIIAFKFYFI